MGNYREPQSANEAALQNILGEQNELREPQSPVEFYLQDIIEKIGGGGSGIPTYELEQYDSKWCAITIQSQDEDPFISQHLFRVEHYSESVIVIGTRTNGTNCLSLVTDGENISRGDWMGSGVGYPKQYRCRDYRQEICSPLDLTKTLYIKEPFAAANKNYMVLTNSEFSTSGYVWMDGNDWVERAGIKPASVNIIDFSQQATAINQILTAIKQIASSSKGTTVNKYYPLDETTAEVVSELIMGVSASVFNKNRVAAIAFNNEIGLISESTFNYFSFHYSEWDFANNLQYDFKITFTPSKIYFQCTCHEATSLM